MRHDVRPPDRIAFIPEHFSSEVPLLGASGAISACMGAFAVLMFKSKIEFKWIVFLFFRLFNGEFFLPTWLVMSFWFLEDLVSAVLSFGDTGSGVAFGAHVGGFVSGALMILVVKWLWHVRLLRRADVDKEELQPAPVTRNPNIYIHENGNQIGPFPLDQVRQMIRLGSIGNEAFYWRDENGEWRSVSQLQNER